MTGPEAAGVINVAQLLQKSTAGILEEKDELRCAGNRCGV